MAPTRGLVSSGRQYVRLNACLFVMFLCSFRLPAVAGGTPKCTDSTPVLDLIATDTTPVIFECGEKVTNLYPRPAEAGAVMACTSSACTSVISLESLEATLQQQKSATKPYTFTISSTPTQASTVYLQCSSTESPADHSRVDEEDPEQTGKRCTVQIAVWGPPIQGSTQYPTPKLWRRRVGLDAAVIVPLANVLFPGKCAANQSTLNLEVNSSNKSVTFACGDGNVLSPALFDHVFSADGCTEESPLADHLSTASLVQHGTTEAGEDAKKPAYTFQVTSLPAEEKTVCYQCKKSSPSGRSNDPPCTVYIKVAKEETDSGSTTTAPPDASGAETGRWSCLTLITSLISVSVLLAKMI
ncbi:SRS domain-containing protein [Neospora caninum Liverpool]|uniref:SRS domain-containing protein n=1 Tax=Neospora caninum (strain Liverpool) TaxID=572307 RepID=F0VDE3_NEOCL|nr:SRS domain-containing protein [Neospora caninum Liverpool]CBZ51658.1 SRS domain-containing protein [Neospora caninum Liverpool]CEL65612.1 TPA: SRS domain-containing protein [Neospora caninum Liverpool]|eukprot:XP_003881691.1 SRS domain-containing protein [Neospora caninum Liverpool]